MRNYRHQQESPDGTGLQPAPPGLTAGARPMPSGCAAGRLRSAPRRRQ